LFGQAQQLFINIHYRLHESTIWPMHMVVNAARCLIDGALINASRSCRTPRASPGRPRGGNRP
jgi:hypothetical protein